MQPRSYQNNNPRHSEDVLSDSDTEQINRQIEIERRRAMAMRSTKQNFKRITKLVKTFESDVDAMADDEYDASDADFKRRSAQKKRHMDPHQ